MAETILPECCAPQQCNLTKLKSFPDLPSLSTEEAEKFRSRFDGLFTIQTFYDGETDGLTKEEIEHLVKPLARKFHCKGGIQEHLAELSWLQRQGSGVFFMVNEGDGKGRCTENVIRVRALFVDLDGAPPEPVRASSPHPHVIVESSPGRYHAYWFIRDCPLDRFRELQESLALRFGGDTSVKDLPRVMRVPGFFHLKNEPFMSRVVP